MTTIHFPHRLSSAYTSADSSDRVEGRPQRLRQGADDESKLLEPNPRTPASRRRTLAGTGALATGTFLPRIGGGTGFSLGWPAVRNHEVYRGGTARSQALATLWLDQTKAPFNKS